MNTDQIKVTRGQKVPRIDGALKVTGTAHYTSDTQMQNMSYAVPIGATIRERPHRRDR